jgi:hypothetical protein
MQALFKGTHSANNSIASSALTDHIPCTAPHLASNVDCSLLYKVPVRGSGTISQGMISIWNNIIVPAPQRFLNQLLAKLEKVLTNLPAGSG